MNALWSLFTVAIAIIGTAVLVLVWIRLLMKKSPSKYLPEASWGEYSSFRENVKSGGISSEKIISYGKTYFTYDNAGKKMFIQTGKIPEGIMLNSDNVISFELCRDGRAIEPEALGPGSDFIETEHIKRSCFDLHITITLKDGSEIILPLIDSPTQYEYVYIRALNVANEITAILKDIINN